jgi:hypothetical protein
MQYLDEVVLHTTYFMNRAMRRAEHESYYASSLRAQFDGYVNVCKIADVPAQVCAQAISTAWLITQTFMD